EISSFPAIQSRSIQTLLLNIKNIIITSHLFIYQNDKQDDTSSAKYYFALASIPYRDSKTSC
ncbi:979_t:CDS:2, partial [Dentiscutata erythropus]